VSVQRRGRQAVIKNLKKRLSNCEDHFLKILFTLSWCRIADDNDFGDLFFESQMHVNKRDKIALTT
jgi:hypothetical protein